MRDLVTPDGYLLLTSDLKVADESCTSVCCGGGCPSWYRLVQCPTGPLTCTGGPPPTPRTIYLCTTVTCLDGSPLVPGGTVVLLAGLCWSVQLGTVPTPPVGAEVRPGNDPVRCVSGCTDQACPQGELYYISRPCSPGVPPIAVCGVTACEVRGCHVLDPATGGIPFSQIPPGTQIFTLADLGPPRQSCCACGPNGEPAGGCWNFPLTEPVAGPPCYASTAGQTCCCTRDDDGEPVGTYRVTRCRVTQTMSRPAFPTAPEYNAVIVLEVLDDCAGTGRLTITRAGQDPEVTTGVVTNFPSSCYPRCPGTWPTRAPRISELNGNHVLVGFEGNTWGYDCAFPNDPFEPYVSRSVTEWDTLHACRQYTQVAEYRYENRLFPDDPRIFVTRFEWTSEVARTYADTCDHPCGGGVTQQPAPGGVVDAGGMDFVQLLAGYV